MCPPGQVDPLGGPPDPFWHSRYNTDKARNFSGDQNKTSSGKQVDKIYAHNQIVFYSCNRELRINLALIPLLGNVAEIQNFLRITKINLWSNLATRGRRVHLHTLVDR